MPVPAKMNYLEIGQVWYSDGDCILKPWVSQGIFPWGFLVF
jgi:hypothetical protein